MSKQARLLIFFLLFSILGGISWLVLKRDKKDSFQAQEISIKQAQVTGVKTAVYHDSAGFSFEYPSRLKVKEVELEDKTIYSSLELEDKSGQKLSLKIADSQFQQTKEWQEDFEKTHVIDRVKPVLWVDIPAVQFEEGIPKTLRTVAVENQVIYEISNQTDKGGFWDQAQKTIIDSFKFDPATEVDTKTEPADSSDSGEIILVEEVIE